MQAAARYAAGAAPAAAGTQTAGETVNGASPAPGAEPAGSGPQGQRGSCALLAVSDDRPGAAGWGSCPAGAGQGQGCDDAGR
ncbi:hypothetical protein HaLaN_11073 [Haematococcus lacustris]|uniref:Uncharacterized protein n=1 Tax=Haematococcus lacustris TaxID=44745 RepID=A0A699YZ21_HAELA|nr:hypothetical protein HaLaN_11073 [Haematococcus lacustris]